MFRRLFFKINYCFLLSSSLSVMGSQCTHIKKDIYNILPNRNILKWQKQLKFEWYIEPTYWGIKGTIHNVEITATLYMYLIFITPILFFWDRILSRFSG